MLTKTELRWHIQDTYIPNKTPSIHDRTLVAYGFILLVFFFFDFIGSFEHCILTRCAFRTQKNVEKKQATMTKLSTTRDKKKLVTSSSSIWHIKNVNRFFFPFLRCFGFNFFLILCVLRL